MSRILLIRPREQSERTAARLMELGHDCLIDPVLAIRGLPLPELDLTGVAAVAVTSAHAAPAVAALPQAIRLYAVGEATARAIMQTVGRGVRMAEGDGASLARLIARDLKPKEGAILHLAGSEVSPGLPETLAQSGHDYRCVTAYAAEPTAGLGDACRKALHDGALDAVLFYSPRSARLWLDKITKEGLAPTLRPLTAVCISPAVTQVLTGQRFAAILVAEEPSEVAMLRCLDGLR